MAYVYDELMDGALSALADPSRRAMLALLRERPHAAGEVAERLRLSQPGSSKHLRVLLNAGLVSARADGPRRIYSLDLGPLTELDAWLEPYREMWEQHLDALEEHLDRKAAKAKQEE